MKTIEYFYSAHSAFAYIGSKRVIEISKENNCRLVHRPVELRAVVAAAGGLPTAERTIAHIDYYFGREIERWAELREAPIVDYRPTHHDKPLDLSNGMLIAAIEQGADIDALSHGLLEAHWRDDADLDSRDALAAAASAAGIDAAPLLDAALSPQTQAIHQANTDEAIARGIFGSPTYFFDGDMFYGQDHLEMLERAIDRPFAANRFKNPA